MIIDDEDEVQDENEVTHDQVELDRDKYWKVVRLSVVRVFRGEGRRVDERRDVVDDAGKQDQEKFYQADPYSVAADIAEKPGQGTPSQQLEYLKIRREVGYGEVEEIPPHLWGMEALSQA